MGDQRKGRQEKADEDKKRVVYGLVVPSQRNLRRVRGRSVSTGSEMSGNRMVVSH